FRGNLWLVAGNSWPVLNDVWRLSNSPTRKGSGVNLPSGATVIDLPGLHNVMRFSDRIYSGGEPYDEGLKTLSRLGIKTVVSVDGAKPRVDQANALGMRYVHIPIGYDGIPEEAGKSFARLVREASAPIYLHCHHGKHRGPAAAAIAYIASTSCEGSEALVFLERVGTSPDYTGLWRDVENYTPPGPDEDLPELVSVAEVGSMVEAMAHIDRHYDNLKLLKEANWSTLEDHPDLVPSQEALLIREAFHESNRQMTSDKREELRTWMKEAEGKAIELETSLKEDRKEDANEHFDSLVQSCKRCHGKYRD
ncbi:MAG: cytochrome c, partial [Candidatus Omnitrophica bacterium]|nr:cytochrome c [Candidatus Omnitrophota bacterium]